MCSVGSWQGWSATHSLEAVLSLCTIWHHAVPQAWCRRCADCLVLFTFTLSGLGGSNVGAGIAGSAGPSTGAAELLALRTAI